MTAGLNLLAPDLGVSGVGARVTTRSGGVSADPYGTLNLALHVGDSPEAVLENRHRLQMALPNRRFSWLKQIHGTAVVQGSDSDVPEADAQWTTEPSLVLAVLTADCLPVVLAAQDGSCVALAHAGWRGLAEGVLEALLQRLPVRTEEVIAWLGPAISAQAYEVGPEVREAFLTQMGWRCEQSFQVSNRTEGHWMADLYSLARHRLERAGVGVVLGGDWCTFSQPGNFFSHRRDGPATGRMATLVWREVS